jgi:hypothetical protein
MVVTATILMWLIRLLAVIQVVLGALFWTSNAFTLIPVHMLLGLILVLGLWTQAALGLRAGAPIGLSAGAFVWGLVVAVFGMTQDGILPGDLHWIIKVLHLLVGLAAVGLAESLARRIRFPARATMATRPI